MSIDSLAEAVQDQALPGVWSKGVALSRAGQAIREVRARDGEILFRIATPERHAQPSVTLWLNDDDWHCDCGDRSDPCPHVVATVLAYKAGRTTKGEAASGVREPGTEGVAAGTVVYRFKTTGPDLVLERYVVQENAPSEKIVGTLVSLVGGQSSGRVSGTSVQATQQDFRLDQAISARAPLHQIVGLLADHPATTVDGQLVQIHSKPRPPVLGVEDVPGATAASPAVRVRKRDDTAYPGERKGYPSGALLIGGTHLFPAIPQAWNEEERACLTPEGRVFRGPEMSRLVEDLLPRLADKTELKMEATLLPRVEELPLDAILTIERHPALGDGTIAVIARLVYGDPAVAEVIGGELRALLSNAALPVRDRGAEVALARRLHEELNLRPGQPTRLSGDDAVRFLSRSQGWKTRARGSFEITSPLVARLKAQRDPDHGSMDVTLEFETQPAGATHFSGRAVIEAWKRGESFLSLGDQGWAPLPRDWLEKHGALLEKIFLARGEKARVPNAIQAIRLTQILSEMNLEAPDVVASLTRSLENVQPDSARPREGVQADLREYQKSGVNWLSLLREAGAGGVLADDMGLGKTLQAIAASRGRTLVVCPASVLVAWREQLARFLPSASISDYRGSNRRLDPGAAFTLCTYGILRQDLGAISPIEWDTVILDEAQAIKNADSQISQAAHSLRGNFRIALSGTPIENRVDDLVSILKFAAPGALADKEERDLSPEELRRRVRPFILRRLKRDVAPELPPRTESVLRCALGDDERKAYDALAFATESEVAKWMQARTGEAAIQALESLLRVRQACNHLSLVPGTGVPTSAGSAKLTLLGDALVEATAAGHRSLVFSQWTSFLDLIEKELERREIGFSRLDGSTRDRGAVVQEFQATDGPPVLLVSLKAGGTGLTLTAADHVYITDPWWNPAVEAQAADRAHRIGQHKPVFIYRVVAENTIEERILALQEAKKELVTQVLGDENGRIDAPSAEELLGLLRG